MRGRSQFIDYHVRSHEMQMRNSTWSNLALTVRALSADLALAHLEWRIEGIVTLMAEGANPGRVCLLGSSP